MEPNELRFVLERKARLRLRRLIADGNTPQKIVRRARIILMTADGHGVMAIMREVGVSKTTVWCWQEYFAKAGGEGLVEGRSKPPGKKPISAAIKLKVVERTVKERRVTLRTGACVPWPKRWASAIRARSASPTRHGP
jgi:hypothetical protein